MIKLPSRERQQQCAGRVSRLVHDLRSEGWSFEEVIAMSAGLVSAILSEITDPEDRVMLAQAALDTLNKAGIAIDHHGRAVFVARA